MDRIRVLLGNQPRMIRGLVRRMIESRTDLQVVGEVVESVELLLAVRDAEPDVVVITLPSPSEDPGITSHLLEEYPGLTVVAVTPDCSDAVVYRRELVRQPLQEVTEHELLRVISGVREGSGWVH